MVKPALVFLDQGAVLSTDPSAQPLWMGVSPGEGEAGRFSGLSRMARVPSFLTSRAWGQVASESRSPILSALLVGVRGKGCPVGGGLGVWAADGVRVEVEGVSP